MGRQFATAGEVSYYRARKAQDELDKQPVDIPMMSTTSVRTDAVNEMGSLTEDALLSTSPEADALVRGAGSGGDTMMLPDGHKDAGAVASDSVPAA